MASLITQSGLGGRGAKSPVILRVLSGNHVQHPVSFGFGPPSSLAASVPPIHLNRSEAWNGGLAAQGVDYE